MDFEKIDLAFLRKRAAAKAALTVGGPWIRRLMEHLRKMRDDGAKRLNTMPGVQCPVPQATPFLFPNIACFGLTSREMAEYLREEAKVIVMNGTSYEDIYT